jgi:hypothetical protein
VEEASCDQEVDGNDWRDAQLSGAQRGGVGTATAADRQSQCPHQHGRRISLVRPMVRLGRVAVFLVVVIALTNRGSRQT